MEGVVEKKDVEGTLLQTQEAYEEAIRECTAAVEAKPEYVKALMRRSEAHEHLEHQEEALGGD